MFQLKTEDIPSQPSLPETSYSFLTSPLVTTIIIKTDLMIKHSPVHGVMDYVLCKVNQAERIVEAQDLTPYSFSSA